MSNKAMQKKLEATKAASVRKYGEKSAIIGNEHYELNVVPSPSLMLDYKLGKGGFPYGAMVEVFGYNGLGKTSALGYGTLANVQKEDKLPAIIAMEPNFDAEWAAKLGLNPEMLLIMRPDNAQEAFEMIYDLVYNTPIDYILLDSIGAMGDQSRQKEGGKTKAFGVSGEITSGLNAIMPRLYKNNQGLMIINQQRQGTGGSPGMTWFESPGGQALKHHALIRIQLKPGTNRYIEVIDGEKVLVGRELKCAFIKNKMAQAANKSAEFDFYNIQTANNGIGVDHVMDVANTAKVAGVFSAEGNSSTFVHDIFPGGKLYGMPRLRKFFRENPEAYEPIRQEVMAKMIQNELDARAQNQPKESDETTTQENIPEN